MQVSAQSLAGIDLKKVAKPKVRGHRKPKPKHKKQTARNPAGRFAGGRRPWFARMRRVLILVIAVFALSAPARADPPPAVTIQDSPCASAHCFAPTALSVAPGTEVTWTSTSAATHKIVPAGGTGTDSWTGSGNIAPTTTYKNTFTNPGTYMYYCAYHPYMTGTITVTGGAPPPPDTPTASFAANPSNPTTGQAVTFDGSASADSDGDAIASYQWTFGDGATQMTSTPATTHSYTAAGSYTATLTVVDAKGHSSSPTTQTVVVTGQPVVTPPTSSTPTVAAPKLSKAHLSTAKLCAKRSRTCKSTSALIRFRLSAAGKVGLVVKRGRTTVRHRTVKGTAGANSLSISATGLKPGRYTLVLTPAGGKAAQLQFKVLAG
jgi:plastocyanin